MYKHYPIQQGVRDRARGRPVPEKQGVQRVGQLGDVLWRLQTHALQFAGDEEE